MNILAIARAVWALFRKDLREHRVALVGLLAFGSLFTISVAAVAEARGAPSMFELAVRSLQLTLPVGALILGHLLVVREDESGTGDLLAALPLAPWVLGVEKLLFGAMGIAALVVTQLMLAAGVAGRVEVVAPTWLLGTVTHFGAWGLGLWALSAWMGSFGRLRTAAWAGFVVGMMVLADRELPVAWWELGFAPISADRWHLPALGPSALWTLGFVAAGVLTRAVFGLGSRRGWHTAGLGMVVLPGLLVVLDLIPEGSHADWETTGRVVPTSSRTARLVPALEELITQVEAETPYRLPPLVLVEGTLTGDEEVSATGGAEELVVAIPATEPAPVSRVLIAALERLYREARWRDDGWVLAAQGGRVREEREVHRTCAARYPASQAPSRWSALRARWGAIARSLAVVRGPPSDPPAFTAGKITGGALFRIPVAPETWAPPGVGSESVIAAPDVQFTREGATLRVEGAPPGARIEWGILAPRRAEPADPTREDLDGPSLVLPVGATDRIAARVLISDPTCPVPGPWVELP